MTMRLRSVIMRGGTSKAVFLREEDLPTSKPEREELILSIFGSPDRRQIDGLGGADPLTSKLAIIGAPDASQKEHCNAVYTFGQVGINTANVDWHSLCGNISAAVGVYAIEEGFSAAKAPITVVRVFNSNLNRYLSIEVPVLDGRPVIDGDYHVPGVPGSGARILIDFSDTAGATTGALLPTGNAIDEISVAGLGNISVTLIDVGNAHVFVRARDIGLKGTESATQIDADGALLTRLEAIRGAAAARMGMVARADMARDATPATPILGIISEPSDYIIELTGTPVVASELDVVSRLQFMQQTHKTYAGTSTVCTGVASRIPGTIVHEASRNRAGSNVLRIGHPAGVIETETQIENGDGGYIVHRATLGRTARRIMEGFVFTKTSKKDAL